MQNQLRRLLMAAAIALAICGTARDAAAYGWYNNGFYYRNADEFWWYMATWRDWWNPPYGYSGYEENCECYKWYWQEMPAVMGQAITPRNDTYASGFDAFPDWAELYLPMQIPAVSGEWLMHSHHGAVVDWYYNYSGWGWVHFEMTPVSFWVVDAYPEIGCGDYERNYLMNEYKDRSINAASGRPRAICDRFGPVQPTNYFSVGELMGSTPHNIGWLEESLRSGLDRTRERYGYPLIGTVGFRCPEHNDAVGSTQRLSWHQYGRAQDVINHPSRPRTDEEWETIASAARNEGAQAVIEGNHIHLEWEP
jgi:hypothetical protein